MTLTLKIAIRFVCGGHSTSWRCTTSPSLVTKCWAVQRVSSVQGPDRTGQRDAVINSNNDSSIKSAEQWSFSCTIGSRGKKQQQKTNNWCSGHAAGQSHTETYWGSPNLFPRDYTHQQILTLKRIWAVLICFHETISHTDVFGQSWFVSTRQFLTLTYLGSPDLFPRDNFSHWRIWAVLSCFHETKHTNKFLY